jgi:hypothetical protein
LPPFAALASEELPPLLPGLLSLEALPPELAASAVLLPDEGPLAEVASALALALPALLWPAASPLGAAAPLAALDEPLLAEEEPPDGDAPALVLPELP